MIVSDNVFSGTGEVGQNLLIKSEIIENIDPERPTEISLAPESQDHKKPIEISGLSEKFIYVSNRYLGGLEMYIIGLRRRFQCKDVHYPVILLKMGDSSLIFPCRINLKTLRVSDRYPNSPIDSIYNYICGYKCTPKAFVTCKFKGQLQTILTDDQKDPRFWTVENWKIYSVENVHSCQIHQENKCGCHKYKRNQGYLAFEDCLPQSTDNMQNMITSGLNRKWVLQSYIICQNHRKSAH